MLCRILLDSIGHGESKAMCLREKQYYVVVFVSYGDDGLSSFLLSMCGILKGEENTDFPNPFGRRTDDESSR